MRIAIHSKLGNAVVGVLGSIYLVAAISLLTIAASQTWEAASMIDRVVMAGLLAVAGVGLWMALSAFRNLSLRRRRDVLIHPGGVAAAR